MHLFSCMSQVMASVLNSVNYDIVKSIFSVILPAVFIRLNFDK